MKYVLMAFLWLFLPTFGFATTTCPEFSGDYELSAKNGEPGVFLTAKQKNCAELTLSYDYGWDFPIVQKHIFDGKRRLVEENEDNEDNGFKAYEIARINEGKAWIEEERHVVDEDTNEKRIYYVNSELSKTADGDLLILRTTLDQDKVVTDTDKALYLKNKE